MRTLTGLALRCLVAVLCVVVHPSLASSAEGLPADVPDLYDANAMRSYQPVPHITTLPCACRSSIITSSLAYAENKDAGARQPMIMVLGWLVENEHRRIIVIVQTFIHIEESGQPRSVRVWIDTDWMKGRVAVGNWDIWPQGITPVMSLTQTKAYLAPLYEAIRKRGAL